VEALLRPDVEITVAEGKVWKGRSHTLILIFLHETRLRRAVEKDVAALQAMQTKRKQATPKPKTKPSVSGNWLPRKDKSMTRATISSLPRPTGSSFFQSPICSAF